MVYTGINIFLLIMIINIISIILFYLYKKTGLTIILVGAIGRYISLLIIPFAFIFEGEMILGPIFSNTISYVPMQILWYIAVFMTFVFGTGMLYIYAKYKMYAILIMALIVYITQLSLISTLNPLINTTYPIIAMLNTVFVSIWYIKNKEHVCNDPWGCE